MHYVEPKIFVIAETKINQSALREALEALGAPDWETDAHSDGELLIEFGGRLCYKSFNLGLNPNITKIREGNSAYLGNILAQKHGSVIEHANVSVAMLDVSRIFTHEMVRHRAGAAFSQESMRFVRLTNIPIWFPDSLAKADDKDGFIHKQFTRIASVCEDAIQALTEHFGLDDGGASFAFKKRITSALRRIAPSGHATNILATGNHRAWRHWIEQRTSPGAEEEIQKMLFMVACDFKERFPAIYQDMVIDHSAKVCSFANSKI